MCIRVYYVLVTVTLAFTVRIYFAWHEKMHGFRESSARAILATLYGWREGDGTSFRLYCCIDLRYVSR